MRNAKREAGRERKGKGAREKEEKPNIPQTHKLSPSYLGLAHNGAGAWRKVAEPTLRPAAFHTSTYFTLVAPRMGFVCRQNW